MSEQSFEDAIRSMLRAAAPAEVPASLEQRALAIPCEIRTTGRGRRAGRTLRGLAGALAAVIVVVALVSAAVLLRPMVVPGGATASVDPIGVASAFGSLSASDLELVVDDRSFTGGPSGWSRPSASLGLDVSITG